MKIALLNIRFEVSEKSELNSDVRYIAKCLQTRSGKFGKASYASIVQVKAPTPLPHEECGELTIADCRGNRKLLDIEVATYHSDNYNIGQLEQFISVNTPSMSKVALDNRRSCSPSGELDQGGEFKGEETKRVGVAKVENSSKVGVTKAGPADAALKRTNEKEVEVKAAVAKKQENDVGGKPKDAVARFTNTAGERGAPETVVRVGDVTVRPTDTGVRPKSQSPTPHDTVSLHFYSGNPTVEKVKGILHIYKDKIVADTLIYGTFVAKRVDPDETAPTGAVSSGSTLFANTSNHVTMSHQISLSEESERSELICMLAVPAKYTIHDLLQFNGPCIRGIEYMRIIRDGSPNQYMVLVKFRSQKLADEYYLSYNNTAFNNIELDVCHLVYVGRVETLKESENACFPVPGMTELPNCPVCLERMDESVDGILTILCNHAFHMECLDKWGDTSCPVCRYCQTPEETSDNRCMKCGSEESLWICLICGNIGCGRYVGLHAYRHFQETQHTYAMELGNNRVWDYVGDNYVHRLIQNKSDGKLVQVDEGGNPMQDEKLDSLNLEYTYLLTNQLESQRQYFEEKIEDIEKSLLSKMHVIEEENQTVTESCSRLECSLEKAEKEKSLAEKKYANLHSRMKKVLHELQEEKTMNKCLLENQAVWQSKVNTLEAQIKDFTTQKDKELNGLKEQLRDVMFYVEAQQKLQEGVGEGELDDLKEQLRDVMFYVEAQQKLQEGVGEGVSQEEIQGGQVIVGATGESPQHRRARKKPR